MKLNSFSGKKEEWVYWAPMFLTLADAEGYCRIADEGDEEVPSDIKSVLASACKLKWK